MICSDVELKALFPQWTPGPCSVDLHLGDALLVWPEWVRRNPRHDQSAMWRAVHLDADDGTAWVLRPGLRYLATTAEEVAIPDDCAAQISARSSWGRDGLSVVIGPAGFIDAGWSGKPTLELSVVGSELVIWPGARVAQLVVHELTSPAAQPYRGRYQGDQSPTPSRQHAEATP
jgi:dCTP deaminase